MTPTPPPQDAAEVSEIVKLRAESAEYKASADLWGGRWSRLKENFDKLWQENQGMKILLENFASNYHLNQSHPSASLAECQEIPCQKAFKYIEKREA